MNKKLLLLLGLVLAFSGVYGQTLNQGLNGWTPVYRAGGVYGDVLASVSSEDGYIYIGGAFDRLIKEGTNGHIGSGAVSTQGAGPVIADYPYVNGGVNAVVSDGAGGWFIAGYFTEVGGVARRNIAHIKPDKSVDLTWDPNPTVGTVAVMVLSGNDLYVGGSFTNIGGQSRNGIAKLSTSGTGAADATWNPNAIVGVSFPSNVSALALSGSDLFVGGGFTGIGGQSRNYIAKLSTTGTGAADATWNPNPTSIVGSDNFGSERTIRSLVVSGTDLYVGGSFSAIGGQTRSRIAKLSTTGTGAADATWNPNASATVYSMALSGSDLFVGGSFISIGGKTYINGMGKISATGAGTADASWEPYTPLGAGTFTAYQLLVDGSNLYASSTRGMVRCAIAGAGTIDGTWNPDPSLTNCFALSGTSLYLGLYGSAISAGSIGGLQRNGVARFTCDMEPDMTWAPMNGAPATIISIVPDGCNVYLAGEFVRDVPNGFNTAQVRGLIKASAAGTGAFQSWVPNLSSAGSLIMYKIAKSGTSLIVGGYFNSIGGQSRKALAKISLADASLDASWNPNISHSGGSGYGSVDDFIIDGDSLYLRGSFTSVGGQTRQGLAKISVATGAVDATWNPNPSSQAWVPVIEHPEGGYFETIYGGVRHIAISGSYLIAAGIFETIGGQNKPMAARISKTGTGAADPSWTLPSGASIRNLKVIGTDLYVAIDPGTTGQTCYVRKYNAATAVEDGSWNVSTPSVTSSSKLYTLLQANNQLLISGRFDKLNGSLYYGLASSALGAGGSCCVLLTPESIPNVVKGNAYSQTITQTGLSSATFSITEGALPAGLSMNAAGAITGTPTAVGTFCFIVQATDGSCSGSRAYSITVACPTITIAPASLANGYKGNAYSETISSTGLTAPQYGFYPSLPPGLSMDMNGVISGTPTTLGSYTFTVFAYESTCNASQEYTMEITCPVAVFSPSSLTNGIKGTAYNRTITQTGFSSPTFSVSAGTLPAGINLSTSGLLSGTPTADGTSNFTVTVEKDGCSSNKEYSLIIDLPIPAVPVLLDANKIKQTGFSARWYASSGALSYTIQVSTDASFNTIVKSSTGVVGATSLISQSFTGLLANTTYYYRVRAVNAAGASAYSSPFQTMTLNLMPPVLRSAASITDSRARLRWYRSSGAISYTIEISTDSLFGQIDISQSGITDVVYIPLGLDANTTYYYRVKAVGANSASGYSSGSVLTKTLPPIAIQAVNVTSSSFVARWRHTEGAIY